MHEAQGHHAPQSALGPLGLPAVRRTADGERRATGQRPRVLFLSCHLPWPPLSGGRRRELELLRRVARRFDVDLLVVSKTPAQDLANRDRLRRPAPPAPAGGRTAGAAIRGQTPWQVLRHRSPAATARVREILAAGQTELIHVEGYYLMQHLPEPSPVPVLLVEQNVEYQLERQMELERQTQLGHPDQPRLTAERRRPRTDAAPPTPAQITEEVERACWRRATRLAAVTGEDARTMRLHGAPAPVAVVPDGADHIPRLHMVRGTLPRPAAPLLVLVANFGYAPNVDAALHLCREILPAIRRQVGELALWLVGTSPPPEVRALADETVLVTGPVADVVPYLDAADVIVCPLRIGGGIKVKMLEALRRGKAIVTSSVGAQGLPPAARRAIVIADDPQQFAHRTSALLQAPQERAALGQRAAHAARQLPTWEEAARRLTALYDELLGRRATGWGAASAAVGAAL